MIEFVIRFAGKIKFCNAGYSLSPLVGRYPVHIIGAINLPLLFSRTIIFCLNNVANHG